MSQKPDNSEAFFWGMVILSLCAGFQFGMLVGFAVFGALLMLGALHG